MEYAMTQINVGDKRMEILELAGAYLDDYEFILSLVQDLVEENKNSDIEKRKIRLVIVNNTLNKKNKDFIAGLMELTDLWSELGYPEDSPHIIQGLNNSISPSEYYTQQNYDILYNKNHDWFMKELMFYKNNNIVIGMEDGCGNRTGYTVDG